LKSLGRNKAASSTDVNHFITTIDQNGDGKISKVELFDILKYLISRN
jgi:Ca2+-binding EF-hand superfamily protein